MVALKGSLDDHRAIVSKIQTVMDKNNMAVKRGKFFQSEIEWLCFETSGDRVRSLVVKADVINNLPIPKNISELRSFFGSINQYVHFVPNLSTLNSPLPLISNKKSVLL